MLIRETAVSQESRGAGVHRIPAVARPNGMYLVTTHDLAELEASLFAGRLPADFERKLCRLAGGSLTERYVEQNSRLIFSLLLAQREGLFHGLSSETYERLLRILAYVRKDEDAVPDYRADGFKDDAQEIRAAEAELKPLLDAFKKWRLRHQVSELWLRAEAQAAKPRDAAC